MSKALMVFSGNANKELAGKIAKYLGKELGEAQVKKFSEGEIFVRIDNDVRGRDVFIVQSTCPPGITRQIADFIISKRSNLRRVYVAYCSERLFPGKALEEIVNNNRIIG